VPNEVLWICTRKQALSPLRASRPGIGPRKAPGNGAGDLHQDEIARDNLNGSPQARPSRVTLLAQLYITGTEAGDVAHQP
jgi:hypothetical protein